MANIDLWGVNEQGFYCPTIEEIIAEKNKKAKELFGEDFDIGELTPQGKFFRVNAAAEHRLCEIAENVYYSIFPSTARGISLDRVCEFVNLRRSSAGYAMHILRIYGKRDYTIPVATKFKNNAGVEFYSVKAVTLNNEDNGKYYGDAIVQCIQSGEIGNVQNINAVSVVDTNIEKIKYAECIAYGTPAESDHDLREKFSIVTNGLGTNTTASIKANVLRVSGVNDVLILDNNTDTAVRVSDKLTIESMSYAVIVHSDNMTINADIAGAILEKQPLGIIQSGTQMVDVKDDSGITHTVKFSYVEPISVNVTIECTTSETFPSNGIQLIKDNITAYINSLGIGKTVIRSRLYDYIYNVEGVYNVTDIKLNGRNADVSVSDVNIARVGNITLTTMEV